MKKERRIGYIRYTDDMIIAIKSGVYFRKKYIIGFENWFTSTILHTYSKLIWKCPHFNTKKVDVKKEMLNSGYDLSINLR